MYYPCSENKGADQLCGYREDDLRPCFRICIKPVFSRRGSINPKLTIFYMLSYLFTGPFRMRKKMIKNELFYINYPYRPDMDNSVSEKKVLNYLILIIFKFYSPKMLLFEADVT